MRKIYCVVKEDKHYIGDKEGVIAQICDFRIENRKVFYKFNGFVEGRGCGYGDEWSYCDMRKDVIKDLFAMLYKPEYRLGYTVFETFVFDDL